MKKYTILPSVLSANFMKLEEELKLCKQSGIEWIHYDVMDYDFVPNLTFGSKILQDIKNGIDINVDIHFMVKVKTEKFEDFFVEYIKAKPQMMTMHIESMTKEEVSKFINMCNENSIMPSLAISPKTPVSAIVEYLSLLSNVLVMTVEPGFGGQSFIEAAADKISELADLRKEKSLNYTIEVDGGINSQTSKIVKSKGIDWIVAGSYLFGQDDFEANVKELFKND